LSADTWRAVTFYVRSLVFNWLVLVPMLLVVVMAAQLYFVAWNRDVAMGFACSTPEGDGCVPGAVDLLPGRRPDPRPGALGPGRMAAGTSRDFLVTMAAVSILWLLTARRRRSWRCSACWRSSIAAFLRRE
jgi:hypothetical protein